MHVAKILGDLSYLEYVLIVLEAYKTKSPTIKKKSCFRKNISCPNIRQTEQQNSDMKSLNIAN